MSIRNSDLSYVSDTWFNDIASTTKNGFQALQERTESVHDAANKKGDSM